VPPNITEAQQPLPSLSNPLMTHICGVNILRSPIALSPAQQPQKTAPIATPPGLQTPIWKKPGDPGRKHTTLGMPPLVKTGTWRPSELVLE